MQSQHVMYIGEPLTLFEAIPGCGMYGIYDYSKFVTFATTAVIS